MPGFCILSCACTARLPRTAYWHTSGDGVGTDETTATVLALRHALRPCATRCSMPLSSTSPRAPLAERGVLSSSPRPVAGSGAGRGGARVARTARAAGHVGHVGGRPRGPARYFRKDELVSLPVTQLCRLATPRPVVMLLHHEALLHTLPSYPFSRFAPRPRRDACGGMMVLSCVRQGDTPHRIHCASQRASMCFENGCLIIPSFSQHSHSLHRKIFFFLIGRLMHP